MSVKLQKGRDKYHDKIKPRDGQAVKSCPWCEQPILITENYHEKPKKIDGFVIAVILAGGVLVTMLILMAQGAG